jgi:hypothetical protein
MGIGVKMVLGITSEAWTLIGAIIGTLLGFCLTVMKEYYDRKPRLSFNLSGQNEEGYLEPEKRTKTSPSDYAIYVCNYGREPVMVRNLSLLLDKKILVDRLINGYTTILPYEKYQCVLTEQDYGALLFHCKKHKLKACDIVADNIAGGEIKGKLDLCMLNMQLSCNL